MEAPVLLMTTHNYSNVVAFNANTGAFITTSLLDLHYQKHLDLPKLAEKGNIQFRAITTRNYNEITLANGQAKHSFFATFTCDRVPGWKLDSDFLVRSPFNFIVCPD